MLVPRYGPLSIHPYTHAWPLGRFWSSASRVQTRQTNNKQTTNRPGPSPIAALPSFVSMGVRFFTLFLYFLPSPGSSTNSGRGQNSSASYFCAQWAKMPSRWRNRLPTLVYVVFCFSCATKQQTTQMFRFRDWTYHITGFYVWYLWQVMR